MHISRLWHVFNKINGADPFPFKAKITRKNNISSRCSFMNVQKMCLLEQPLSCYKSYQAEHFLQVTSTTHHQNTPVELTNFSTLINSNKSVVRTRTRIFVLSRFSFIIRQEKSRQADSHDSCLRQERHEFALTNQNATTIRLV